MASYTTFTTCGDMGAWVSKLILDLPTEVRACDVTTSAFNVFSERLDPATGEVVMAREHHGDPIAHPSHGYVPVRAAYPCDAQGTPAERGTRVALDLPEIRLTKHCDGNLKGTKRRDVRFRVAQLAALPASAPVPEPLCGLVWDERGDDASTDLAGWSFSSGTFAGRELAYGYFEPDFDALAAKERVIAGMEMINREFHVAEKVPLIVWLHGAGEGGSDPWVTVTGNKVTALSGEHIQDCMGGAAYVLAPTSPTYWMDDGEEQLGESNRSIWENAVMEMIRAFVVARPRIDADRIYVGGLSNGGFMTCRLLIDNPDYFAAALPVCAPFFEQNATAEVIDAIKDKPIWFVHGDDDPLVLPERTVLPLMHALLDAGARNAHLTYYDRCEDLSGAYHDRDGRPQRYIGHFVWIQTYDDYPRTDIDGHYVTVGGRPVTIWQWLGMQRLEK